MCSPLDRGALSTAQVGGDGSSISGYLKATGESESLICEMVDCLLGDCSGESNQRWTEIAPGPSACMAGAGALSS